jgi:hypothetical protein
MAQTTIVDLDTRGICALRDEGADPVLSWFDELKERLGDPAAAGPDTSFDEAPWAALPTFEQLWDPVLPLSALMRDLVIKAAHYGDIEEMLSQAQRMADVEYELRKGRERDVSGEVVDGEGSGVDGSVGAVVAGGGGEPVPGGSEDGDAVGEGGAPAKLQNDRRPPKVQSRRGAKKAA